MRRITRSFWSTVTANKKRKIAAASMTLLACGGALAFFLAPTLGTGSGSQNFGSQSAINLTLHASWADGLQPTSAANAAANSVPLTLNADNDSAQDGIVRSVKLEGVSSPDPACNTALQQAGGGVVVFWGLNGEAAGNTAGNFNAVNPYALPTPITVTHGAHGVNLLTQGIPAVALLDSGADQTACQSKSFTLNFSASS